MGYKDHAAFVLEDRMAKSPAAVKAFLEDLNTKLEPLSAQEMKYLLQLKEEECKAKDKTFDGVINGWDLRYYLRIAEERKYKVNHLEIAEYFPLDVVTKGLFDIYQELLGLEFKQIDNPHVWHPEVTMYRVDDRATGKPVGQFYLDLFPRPGTYTHAACFGLLSGIGPIADEKGSKRNLAAAAMVANFSRPVSDKPSLLKHNEVITYFHEFGHVMHQLCSAVTLPRFAGTQVEKDFVEAPSQMLENWCWQPEALLRMSGHYLDKKKQLPEALVEPLSRSRNANVGILTKRQILYGMFDQALHTRDSADLASLFAELSAKVFPVPNTPGTNFGASFGHLAGGYDAAYYGYLWSEVYSVDMFESRFSKEGIFSPKVGSDYRYHILSKGGSEDAMDLLKKFLGREPSMEPFLKNKGLVADKV